MDLYSRLESDIRLSRLSPTTSKHYLPHCRKFMSRFPDREPGELGESDVRAYLHHLVDERKVSQYTHKMAVAALKFLFQRTLQRPEVVAGIPWPKIREALAVVLAHQELLALFRAADSPLIHAAMLCGYAAGLRVSEVCSITDDPSRSEPVATIGSRYPPTSSFVDSYSTCSPEVSTRSATSACTPHPRRWRAPLPLSATVISTSILQTTTATSPSPPPG